MDQVIMEVPLSALEPNEAQPRQHFDDAALHDLAASIRQNGVLSPLLVSPIGDGRFAVIGGHRRLRAATIAEVETVPIIVRDLDAIQRARLTLLDNLHRADFLPWEEGAGFAALLEMGETIQSLVKLVSKSEQYIRNRLLLHEQAGEAARAAYLAKEIGLAALIEVAQLPDRHMSVKQCPYCRKTTPATETLCRYPDCRQPLPTIPHGGNPQSVAVRLCKGLSADECRRICRMTAEAYALTSVDGQLGLTLDEMRVKLNSVEARHRLAVVFADATARVQRLTEKPETLSEIPREQREAILEQAQLLHKAVCRLESILRRQE